MELRIRGISTAEVEQIRNGGLDANGQPPLLRAPEGLGGPCRHCLGLIEEGEEKLILSYRPFDELQPYAESGPIFLHKGQCDHYDENALPGWFAFLEPAIVRGYGKDHWIRYETGDVVAGAGITAACESIFEDPMVEYVHIRSKFNCFQCRVDRA